MSMANAVSLSRPLTLPNIYNFLLHKGTICLYGYILFNFHIYIFTLLYII